MPLNNQEKSMLKVVLTDPKWQIVEKVAIELCNLIKSNSVVRDNDQETLKVAYQQDGELQGINKFIQELFKQIE